MGLSTGSAPDDRRRRRPPHPSGQPGTEPAAAADPGLRASPEDRPGPDRSPPPGRTARVQPRVVDGPALDPADTPMRARGRLVSWLRRDLARAHQLLRRSTTTGGRGSPYRLPWILVMGPPAAGKTRAVARAGLAYPDEDLRGGRQDAAGRTLGACVWLGDRAVLVDTGGALATDPAEAEDPDAPDRQARAGARLWRALVQRVRDERPALPLNAVILAVPLPWLAASTRERREAAARLLRQRLETVYQVTGQRLPIHVWLTQADRLAGFHASFETLGGQERDQVWGFSLPLAGPGREETALVAVPAGLDGLVRRLNARLLERLHQDPGMRQGAAIWAFPVQVASLRGPLSHMMEALFRGGGWQESLLPRSVHLVSGGVGGAAVDRLGPLLARRFSLDAPSMEAGADPAVDRVHDPERGWFLARALGGVILGEAGLVAGSAGRRRTRVMRNRLAMLAGLLVMGLGVALWGKSLLGNHALLDRAEADATTLREQIHGLAISGVSDTDFAAILPPLDMLREMPLGPARGGGPSSWTLTLGLYQGHAVHEAAGTTYDRALLRLLGPRLLLALERQLAAPGDPADAGRRVAMTAYLMLGDRRAFDGEVVWRWLESLATRALPGASAEAEAKRRALLRHAAAFLALGPPPMVLTPALEDRARLILGPGGVR